MAQINKALIADLQKRGYGYKKISALTGFPLNTVKTQCHRFPVSFQKDICPQCGKSMEKLPHKKAKSFCSDKCRQAWWRQHTEVMNRRIFSTHTCKNCNTTFTSYGNTPRTYCSRACFYSAKRKEVQIEQRAI